MTRLFITGHKTGTVLVNAIFNIINRELYFNSAAQELSNKNFDLNSVDTYFSYDDRIIQELPLSYKGIRLIRNPYERIVSGFRYHKSGKEDWTKNPMDFLPNKISYYTHLNKVSQDEGLCYEMMNSAYRTIYGMYNFNNEDKNFLTLKLEDFMQDHETTTLKMLDFLEFSEKEKSIVIPEIFKLNKKKLLLSSENKISSHFTNNSNEVYTYHNYLKPLHYELFNTIFPSDVFKKLGYIKTI